MTDQQLFYNAIENHQIEWRKHALQRMFERSIQREEVIKTLLRGEIIEMYKYDTPFPSMLYFAMVNNRPLHVVAAFEKVNSKVYIITAYEPNVEEFESDFKTRKKHE